MASTEVTTPSTWSTWRRRALWAVAAVVVLLVLAFVLFLVEASVGHDGLLCELGYDSDGAGTGDTGCG